jgi:hypothetical protein
MKKRTQATQNGESRSITQEMHQAFADWVNKLPFIKKDVPKTPHREVLDDESTEKKPEGIDDGRA